MFKNKYMCSIRIKENVTSNFDFELKINGDLKKMGKFKSNVLNPSADLNMVVLSEMDINDNYDALMKKFDHEIIDIIAFSNGFGSNFTDFGSLKGWYQLKSLSYILKRIPMMLFSSVKDINNDSQLLNRLVDVNQTNSNNVFFVINRTVFYNFNYQQLEINNKEIVPDQVRKETISSWKSFVDELKYLYRGYKMVLFTDKTSVVEVYGDQTTVSVTSYDLWKEETELITNTIESNFDLVIANGMNGYTTFESASKQSDKRYIVWGNTDMREIRCTEIVKEVEKYTNKLKKQIFKNLPPKLNPYRVYGNYKFVARMEYRYNENEVKYLSIDIINDKETISKETTSKSDNESVSESNFSSNSAVSIEVTFKIFNPSTKTHKTTLIVKDSRSESEQEENQEYIFQEETEDNTNNPPEEKPLDKKIDSEKKDKGMSTKTKIIIGVVIAIIVIAIIAIVLSRRKKSKSGKRRMLELTKENHTA